MPTAAEIEEHEALEHVQFRDWCPVCLGARGIGQQHRATEEEDTAEPTVVGDYGFMGQDDGKCMPMLVLRDRRSKTVAATFVPEKGRHPYAIRFFSNFLRSLGHRKVLLKSDGEIAMRALKERAAQDAQIEWIPKEAIPDDHKAMGEIEVMVREVKRQVRAMKLSLQRRLQNDIVDSHPILAWMPRHAADCISRFRKGPDGLTAERRRTGKNWRRPLLCYGEKLMYREAGAKRFKNDLEAKMHPGWYIGHHGRRAALLVLTPEGVKRACAVKRLTAEERWDFEGLKQVTGLPWDVQSRERRSQVAAVADEEAQGVRLPPIVMAPPQKRRLYVLAADIERFGPTDSCAACAAVVMEGHTPSGLSHTDGCRQRIEE